MLFRADSGLSNGDLHSFLLLMTVLLLNINLLSFYFFLINNNNTISTLTYTNFLDQCYLLSAPSLSFALWCFVRPLWSVPKVHLSELISLLQC